MGVGSPFWRSLNKIKHLFKMGAKHSVRNGKRTSFWHDAWNGDGLLRDRFPLIFAIYENQHATVAEMVSQQLALRWMLDHAAAAQWVALLHLINHTVLVERGERV